ncbi:MAG: hypothetical protein ACJAUY_001628 [Cognaticolwellia sp.]|jgi:hypothetical protein
MRTHDSYQLFNSLPEETKNKIGHEFNKENKHCSGIVNLATQLTMPLYSYREL